MTNTTTPAPTAPPKTGAGYLPNFLTRAPAAPAKPAPRTNLSRAAQSALPVLTFAARRFPAGLALIGIAAAGVALAHTPTREKILDAGRKGLAALRS